MTNKKQQASPKHNVKDVHEQILFDEALRRLVNTPPKHKRGGKVPKPKKNTKK